jgi:phosphate uptake regulator
LAFAQDDVRTAQGIAARASTVNKKVQSFADTVTEKMGQKKTRHFELGACLLEIAHHLQRAGERVTNIAERIVFVHTGALQELERED